MSFSGVCLLLLLLLLSCLYHLILSSNQPVHIHNHPNKNTGTTLIISSPPHHHLLLESPHKELEPLLHLLWWLHSTKRYHINFIRIHVITRQRPLKERTNHFHCCCCYTSWSSHHFFCVLSTHKTLKGSVPLPNFCSVIPSPGLRLLLLLLSIRWYSNLYHTEQWPHCDTMRTTVFGGQNCGSRNPKPSLRRVQKIPRKPRKRPTIRLGNDNSNPTTRTT